MNFTATTDYNSHLPLLKKCLDITSGAIVELGSGLYSTPLLCEYAAENNRMFYSFDNNKEWSEKTGAIYVQWDSYDWVRNCGIVFIDEAPAEHRKESIEAYRNIADVLVIHDTEPTSNYVYGLSDILNTFKYRVDFMPMGMPHSTALSNTIDLIKLHDN